MTWALLVVLVLLVGIMGLVGGKRIPWSDKLRRIHAGVAGKAEWLAPDEVVEQVKRDYLAAGTWLHRSLFRLSPRLLDETTN